MRSFAIQCVPVLAVLAGTLPVAAAEPACLTNAVVQYELTAADRTIGVLNDNDARIAELRARKTSLTETIADAEATGLETEATVAARINLGFVEVLLQRAEDQRDVAKLIFDRRMQTIIDQCGDVGPALVRERYGF